MIQDLPTEIIDHIACLLGQNDALALANTHSTLSRTVLPRLYRSIHVDSRTRNPADLTCVSKDNQQHATHGTVPVIVRSLYALNLLLKKLQRSKHACLELETLVFHEKIPDVLELAFLQSLSDIFPHCRRLSVFHWFCLSFNFPLHKLNGNDRWSQVCGNFEVSGIQNLISWPSLTTLEISNAGSPSRLDLFDLGACTNLQHLRLGQNPVLGSLPFDTSSPTPISQLFSGTGSSKPLNLRSLALASLHVSVGDVRLLRDSVNFLSLHHLTIVHCAEESPGILMASIAPYLRELRSLHCEWKRPFDFNYETMHFLRNLKKASTLITSITFKMKIGCHQDCGQVLAQVLSECSVNVKELSVEVNGSYCSVLGANKMMGQLRRFENIQSLHLLLAESQIPAIMKIFRYLTRLKHVSFALPESRGKHTASVPVEGNGSLICDDMLHYHLSCGWDWFAPRKSQFCNYSNDIVRIQPCIQWIDFDSERHYSFKHLNGEMSDASMKC